MAVHQAVERSATQQPKVENSTAPAPETAPRASADPTGTSDSAKPPEQQPEVRGACLPYEPKTVTLHGVIEPATSPGPPNYESIARGDAKETYWVLKLRQPICTEASHAYENQPYVNVRKIQLVFFNDEHGPDPYTKYRPLLGRVVEATGELFGAATGHHHTDVLLKVSELMRVQAAPK